MDQSSSEDQVQGTVQPPQAKIPGPQPATGLAARQNTGASSDLESEAETAKVTDDSTQVVEPVDVAQETPRFTDRDRETTQLAGVSQEVPESPIWTLVEKAPESGWNPAKFKNVEAAVKSASGSMWSVLARSKRLNGTSEPDDPLISYLKLTHTFFTWLENDVRVTPDIPDGKDLGILLQACAKPEFKLPKQLADFAHRLCAKFEAGEPAPGADADKSPTGEARAADVGDEDEDDSDDELMFVNDEGSAGAEDSSDDGANAGNSTGIAVENDGDDESDSDSDYSPLPPPAPAATAPPAPILIARPRRAARPPPVIRSPPAAHPIWGANGIMHGLALAAGSTAPRRDPRLIARQRGAKVFGHNGLQPGRWFPYQMSALWNGAHGEAQAGIAGDARLGAYSIVISGRYKDQDEDLGDLVWYSADHSLSHSNPNACPPRTKKTRSLVASAVSRRPVRVLRQHHRASAFAPSVGIRYDGLYTVQGPVNAYNKKGGRYERFALRRVAGQPALAGIVNASPTAQEVRDFARVREGY